MFTRKLSCPAMPTGGVLVLILALATIASGDMTVMVPFHDAGFFGADGRNSKEDGEALGLSTAVPTFANYHVGLSDGYSAPPFPDTEVRNFFVFDWDDALADFGGAIPGMISSATLKLYNPGLAEDGEDGYDSPDASETYYLSDIGPSTPEDVMGHYDHPFYGGPDESPLAMMIYEGLGSGPEFGTYEVSESDNGEYVSIDFSAVGLDYLNILLGEYDISGGLLDKFAFGGKLTSIDGVMGDDTDDPYEEAFGYTHPNAMGSPDTSATPPYLELTFVPEPASMGLLGLGAIALLRRRRR